MYALRAVQIIIDYIVLFFVVDFGTLNQQKLWSISPSQKKKVEKINSLIE